MSHILDVHVVLYSCTYMVNPDETEQNEQYLTDNACLNTNDGHTIETVRWTVTI
jgi:hypothetical protein